MHRPDEARIYVHNSLRSGEADYAFYFGDLGDEPYVGDFNGNDVDSFGLRRDAAGVAFIGRSSRTSGADGVTFGNPGDQIVAGDWDGDGVSTMAAYRPSNGRLYYRNSNRSGAADGSIYLGMGLRVLVASGIDPTTIRGKPLPEVLPQPEPETTNPEPEADKPWIGPQSNRFLRGRLPSPNRARLPSPNPRHRLPSPNLRHRLPSPNLRHRLPSLRPRRRHHSAGLW